MGSVQHIAAVPAFATLYVVAALLGRATVVEDRATSLVWPATGVAVVWLLTLTTRLAVTVSAILLVAATVLVNALIRPDAGLIPVFLLATLVQVAAVVVLVRRWCPELGTNGGRPPLETTTSLLRFMVAAALGCLAGVVVGIVGLATSGEPFTPASAMIWWGRSVCGVLAFGTTGLLLVHRLARRGLEPGPPAPGGRFEALGLVTTTIALVAMDHSTGLPLLFLLPATTVWAGLRFSPLVVSGHAALGGVAVIWLTLSGHGLFAGATSRQGDLLLAQAFVGMTIMTGLFLAAGRQESTRLQAQLHERQRELAAFTRRAAHDLQNPLTVIEGWSQILATTLPASSSELHMVSRIQSASTQMRGLVSDLLADATARDREIVLERVDLAQLAEEIAEARGAAEMVRVGDVPPVLGDATMLRQLLDNLIGNGLKYVLPGESAQISVEGQADRDGRVLVTVADRGIGLPPGTHDTVFTEFVRAHADAYPGTGLGLSICRSIVKRHGGAISARDRGSGRGTAFLCRLPLWQPSPPGRRDLRTPAIATTER